jgi:hypothetical protein
VTVDTSLKRAVGTLLKLAVVGIGLLLGACSSIQPWVKPYERDRLADPIMSWDRDAISGAYMDHIYESREGSRGATGTAGGGCGCN